MNTLPIYHKNQRRWLQWTLCAFGLSLLSCAHQLTPTGGPEDHTPPAVVSSSPLFGSLSVGPHSSIVINFSKWISPKTVAKSISIQPPLDGGITIDISGKRLEITPKKPLTDSTTYHVIITSTLQDLRGNPLMPSYSLTFSTGAVLDSGRVAGCVFDPKRHAFQAIVGLYAERSTPAPDSILFGIPTFLVQTDSSGFFSLSNIHSGVYRIVAFIDKNGNNRLDPGIEDAFAPVRRSIAVSKAPDTLLLFPVENDTAAPRLEWASAISATIVMCKWTAPPDSLHGCSEPVAAIERFDTIAPEPHIKSVAWCGNRSLWALFLGDTLSLKSYRLICRFSRKSGNAVVAVADTLRFNGTAAVDTVRPVLTSYSPLRAAPLLPEIKLCFSKLVALAQPLALVDSLRDTVPLVMTPEFSDTQVLRVSRRLHPGSRYVLKLTQNCGTDVTGNPVKTHGAADSTGALFFAAIDADSVALSLRGCAPCLPPDESRKWRFLPFSGEISAPCRDSAGCFHFDSIPYGKGNVEYFGDMNNNDKPDPGRLVPWIAPEPFMIFADTIEARARWEIEGVTFTKACAHCGPAPAPAPSPAGAVKKPSR